MDTVNRIAEVDGGCNNYSAISTAAVLEANIKANRGKVFGLQCFNINAAPMYVKIYDTPTTPTASMVPIWRGIIPGNTAAGGHSIPIPVGIQCKSGIGIRVSAGIADSDTTALGANEVIVNVNYF